MSRVLLPLRLSHIFTCESPATVQHRAALELHRQQRLFILQKISCQLFWCFRSQQHSTFAQIYSTDPAVILELLYTRAEPLSFTTTNVSHALWSSLKLPTTLVECTLRERAQQPPLLHCCMHCPRKHHDDHYHFNHLQPLT